MRRKISKIKLILMKYLVDIYCLLFTNNKNKRVAIISCYEWKNKVLEDINLKYYLAKIHIKADIVAWEEKVDYTKYDAIIIKSVWGFEVESFNKWLKETNEIVQVINPYHLINRTFSKKNQFEILDKYSISHIPTQHVKSDKNVSKNIKKIWDTYYSDCNKLVIKPDISESGENTFILTKKENMKNSITFDELAEKFSNQDITLLIQPYIEEVKNGEFSVILFNKKISHAIIRYPGIFTNTCSCTEMADIPKDILDMTDKIINLEEFKGFTYIRLDFIKKENKYLVLEIELIDPLFFINYIKNKKKRADIFKLFSTEIKNCIEKREK